MNIKKFIADKIEINKKKIFKKSLKECFFSFVGLSAVFNSISYLATKDKFDINSFLCVSGFIFFLLSVSFLINLAIEKYLIKKENNDILLSSENFGKYFKKKDINEEDKKNIDDFCKNSILNNDEINLIKRMILGEDKKFEINNEYLMMKFLNEVDKQQMLKKEFNDPNRKIKEQMSELKKMTEKSAL